MNVSVVIPVFNRAATVGHAVRSVLAQSHPVLEVIVVDDGSSDASGAVVTGIGDRRVRYVRQDNAGAGAARNRGLDLATGDWVAFLDSDDWWDEGRVAAAAAALDASPELDFLQSNRLHVYADGRRDRGLKAPPPSLRDPLRLVSGFTIKTSAVMIRRELIDRYGLRFPTDQKTCEDYHLFWRAVVTARAVGFTERPDVLVRALPDSLSRGNSRAYLQRDNIKTLIEVRAWARSNGVAPRFVDALTEHLHWQFRDYFVMLIRARRLTTLVRYVAMSARHEGVARGARGFASALRGFATPAGAVER